MKNLRLKLFRWLATVLIMVVIVLNYFSNEFLFEQGFTQLAAYILPTLCLTVLNNWVYLPLFFNKNKYLPYFVILIATIMVAQWSTGYLTVFHYFNKHWYFLVYDFLRYFITAMAGFGVMAFYHLSLQQQLNFQKELIIKNSELSLLKKQLNPHFLFNNLNNIYYQCLGTADKAADLVAKLSALMRYTLEYSVKDETTIGREVEFISNYISLEKARLPDNARASFTSFCEDQNLKLCPLLLITYVENCFKHGTNMQQEKIDIDINLQQQNQEIELTCKNRIAHHTERKDSTGVGIKNTETRLGILYAGRYHLQKEVVDDYYVVKLKIRLKNEN